MKQQELSSVSLAHASSNDEFVKQSYDRMPQMLKAGKTAGEELAGSGASVSILILDENGLLRNGESPNLP